jgi:hypothetical protein
MRASRSVQAVLDIGTADLNAPAAILRYEPRQKSNDFNGAKITVCGRSNAIAGPRKAIAVEVIDGREWQEVVSSHGVKSYVSRIAQRALAL